MTSKTFINIGFDQDLFLNQLIGTKVSISSNIPANSLKIRPNKFSLKTKGALQKVILITPSLKKLGKIKEINDLFGDQPPSSVTLTVTQTTQNMIFTKDFEIPIITEGK